jgi:hypothetical protein
MKVTGFAGSQVRAALGFPSPESSESASNVDLPDCEGPQTAKTLREETSRPNTSAAP